MNGNLTPENLAITFPVAKHVSGESKAASGHRLVRVIAKKDSQGNYASPNLQETKSVSIPLINKATVDSVVIEQFMPQILEMFSSFQDAMIADKVKGGASEIYAPDLTFSAIAKFLTSETSSSRLTKETLQAWFMDAYADVAMDFICTMLKWDIDALSQEQEKILEDKINVLRDLFSGFSSGKYSPDDGKCKAMIKFVAFAGDTADTRLVGFGGKAQDIMTKRAEELDSNALGF